PEHLQPMIEFLALTGWRKSEALGLQWRSVDFEGGVVRLNPDETKRGSARTCPFRAHPRLKALLEAQRERVRLIERGRARIVAHVFPKPDGERIRDFYAAWRTACDAAGTPGSIPHDLRRGAARAMERAGVSRSVSMKLLGHRTTSIFERYAICTESDLAEGVARIAALETGAAMTEQKK
ncbi:MAG TPA: site-specific integrase, partial [Candidatus Eisenbacteria bacterium]|nr:site-specific integrase [Candidatus Eisenbacteria bacterium]